jgi:hypothetical protein
VPSLRPIAAVIALLALPVPAHALDLSLVNQSSLIVTGLSLYPLDAQGEPIEDNLGGTYDSLLPGAETRLSPAATCGPMLAVVTLDKGNDLRLKLDTCKDTAIVVRD